MSRRSARSVTESIVVYSGYPVFLGTIDFTGTSKTNAQATTPFSATFPGLAGKALLLQTDQDVYVLPVTTSTGTVTSSNGVKLSAGERVTITMPDRDQRDISGDAPDFLAALQVSAGGNLKVWELK